MENQNPETTNSNQTSEGFNPGQINTPGSQQNFSSKMSDTVTDWVGVERLEGFKLGDVFSEALKKHSSHEVEDYFTVGALTYGQN